jgi:hypothetical protein
MKIILALLLLCVISAPLAGGPIFLVTAAGTTLNNSTGPDQWLPPASDGDLWVVSTGSVFLPSGAPGLTNTVFLCLQTCNVGFVFEVQGADASFGWLPGNPLVLHLSGAHYATPVTATYYVSVTASMPIPVDNPSGLMTLPSLFDVDSDPILMGGPPSPFDPPHENLTYNLRVYMNFGTQAPGFWLSLPDSFEIQVVPEAQSWMLVGAGLFALVLRRRLRA